MNQIGIGKIRSALGKSNGPLLVVYLLFVIFPHFAAITHTHPGGNLPHTHAFLNTHDENLKRKVLEAIGDGSGLKSVSFPAVLEEVSANLLALERETSGLRPLSLWHTHFQEDPNLLAMGVVVGLVAFMMLLRTRPSRPALALPELLAVSPVARGPPGFFLLR